MALVIIHAPSFENHPFQLAHIQPTCDVRPIFTYQNLIGHILHPSTIHGHAGGREIYAFGQSGRPVSERPILSQRRGQCRQSCNEFDINQPNGGVFVEHSIAVPFHPLLGSDINSEPNLSVLALYWTLCRRRRRRRFRGLGLYMPRQRELLLAERLQDA